MFIYFFANFENIFDLLTLEYLMLEQQTSHQRDGNQLKEMSSKTWYLETSHYLDPGCSACDNLWKGCVRLASMLAEDAFNSCYGNIAVNES